MTTRVLPHPSIIAALGSAAILLSSHVAQADGGAGITPIPGSAQTIVAEKNPQPFLPNPSAMTSNDPPAAGGSCRPGSMAAIMSAKLPPNARPTRLGNSCP